MRRPRYPQRQPLLFRTGLGYVQVEPGPGPNGEKGGVWLEVRR